MRRLKWRLLKRFLNKLIIGRKSDCWEWQGSKTIEGYGRIKIEGVWLLAHRMAWMIDKNEEVPSSMEICHSCDNPPCCNPYHLFLGTHRENMKDMAVKKRSRKHAGSNNGNSKLTEDRVREINRFLAAGGKRKEAAANNGVCLAVIDRIVNKIHWKHV